LVTSSHLASYIQTLSTTLVVIAFMYKSKGSNATSTGWDDLPWEVSEIRSLLSSEFFVRDFSRVAFSFDSTFRRSRKLEFVPCL
jgi:hypothetical protein